MTENLKSSSLETPECAERTPRSSNPTVKHLKELIKSVRFLLCICKAQNPESIPGSTLSLLIFVSAAIDLRKISIAGG